MATVLESPPKKTAAARRVGWLEFFLLISFLALIVQIAGPSIWRVWKEWPRPGRQVPISPLLTKGDRQWEVQSWIYYPEDYSSDRKFPLLLFLHGSGERSTDLQRTIKHGLPGILAKGKQLPMFVLSPQCLPERNWENDELLALLDWAEAKYSIDPDRIYVCGFSMGGYGTWHLAGVAPERFAAIVPVSGGGNEGDAERLAKLPIWAFHGDQDHTVPVEQTTKMITAIKKAGGSPGVSILRGRGHGISGEVLARRDLYEWLFEQRRMDR